MENLTNQQLIAIIEIALQTCDKLSKEECDQADLIKTSINAAIEYYKDNITKRVIR